MTGRQIAPDPAALAGQVAELVRALNYATLPREGQLTYPGDVYDVLGSLTVAAERLPQLCGQLWRFLAAELAAGRVQAVDGQPYAGDPGAAVTAAVLALADACAAAKALAGALSRAQQATSGLAYDDSAPVSCASCGAGCGWADNAWTCTDCGDEWYPDPGAQFASPNREVVVQ